MIVLDDKDEKWLRQHGNRSIKDVLVDPSGGKYVLMSDGNGMMEKVHLHEVYRYESERRKEYRRRYKARRLALKNNINL